MDKEKSDAEREFEEEFKSQLDYIEKEVDKIENKGYKLDLAIIEGLVDYHNKDYRVPEVTLKFKIANEEYNIIYRGVNGAKKLYKLSNNLKIFADLLNLNHEI